MSTNIQLAKRKYTQNDLRRLLQEQKTKKRNGNPSTPASEKIQSPLAHYDKAGTLSCILCKSVVRSEAVWKVHINSKNHKEKVEKAKQIKERLDQNQKQVTKRPNESSAVTSPPTNKKLKIEDSLRVVALVEQPNGIPEDFFDSKGKNVAVTDSIESDKVDNALPEGFFDDPKRDAIVRNIDYKDPQEEEWQKFQKEIKDETSVSLEIIAGEVEASTNDRQIQDIDEQMYNWQRVLNMEKKREDISEKLKSNPVKMECSDSSAEESEGDDFDEFLDWRAKKITKK